NKSSENRFIAKSDANFSIQDIPFHAAVKLDYLGGNFERNYYTTSQIKYGNIHVGLQPTYRLTKDDVTLDVGASLYFLNDTQFGKSKFFIYPNIKASYRIVNEILIAYAGIQGDLIQNSYSDFVQENPFMSPTLFITPTDQKLNSFIGLKGKISSTMSYNIKGKYIAETNKALIKNNEITAAGKTYMHGNSFAVVYDNVSTINLSGEINADVNRNFSLGMKLEYFAYQVDQEKEAWNLPDFKGNLFVDYQINKQWFAGANLIFVGQRKDAIYQPSLLLTTPRAVTLDSYFDANANVGYHINSRFSVYAKVNNIANKNYNRWQNYAVQGIQLLAGATYKFDF
ncbi:MAG: TonB-dependent receptor, partial [Oceanihabitans sp.]